MKSQRHVFAVCDLELSYACSFMEYMNRKRNIPFEVQAFTNVEALLEFGKVQEIEILLISDRAMCREVKELSTGQTVILSGGGQIPEMEEYPSVYKYQSSDSLIREVMEIYAAKQETLPIPEAAKRKTAVIGVYSPVGRCQKTSFALTLGQIMARERAVLYLNLEAYSGFEQLLETQYELGLSDLLYYIRQENSNLIHKMNAMVRSIQNLDYIPPAVSPIDLQNTGAQEWGKLLDEISRCSSYEAVILDIGDAAGDIIPLLESCRRIYMPVRTDLISSAKIAQFESQIKTCGSAAVQERIRRLRLPYHNSMHRGKEYIEGLVWSELGDYVRQLLREEQMQL